MGLLKSIKRWMHRKPTPEAPREVGYEVKSQQISRWGAIAPHRINREHYAHAHNESINNDLSARLHTLQAYCAFEYGTNPDFEGVVNTYKDDVVGRNGPALQVVSESTRFNEMVEAGYRDIFADPDPSHRYGGVEDMKTWVHGLLLAGSYVNINTTVDRVSLGSDLQFGWRSVHPRRLVTPLKYSGDPHVAFGTRWDPITGAAIEHYIARPQQSGSYSFDTGEFDTVPAAAVQHCFMPTEAEQLTGCPWMASTLETAADLRVLDKFVLESMKNSAANSPGLQAMNPELVINPDPVPTGKIRQEPGEIPIAPPGWAFASLTATQPSAQYLPFKHEKAAELGRPIHMPLLVVLLTAADANFSSAQYEGTVYADGISNTQGFIQRRSLNPFVLRGLIPELALRKRLAVPKTFELIWTWHVPAHANIEKQVKAIRMMIEDGVIAPSYGSAMLGYDWEKVVKAREKCAQQLEKAKLPPSPVNAGNPIQEPSDEQPEGRKDAQRFSLAI